MVDVREFGVTPGAENTTALRALFRLVEEGRVRELYFPAGQYYHQGLTLTGAHGFTITGPGELVATTPTITQYLRFLNCTDFTVTGLASRHENPTARRGASPARTISLEGCTRFHIHRCHAHHGEGVGIMVWDSTHGTISDNIVQWTKADGIGLYGDTHHVTVTGNTTFETGDDGIAQVGVIYQGVMPHHNAITGNTVGRSRARGIVVVGAHDTAVTGNTVDGTMAAGIYVTSEPTRGTYGCRNVVVSANTVSEANTYNPTITQAGIFIFGGEQPVENVTVTGNSVSSSGSDGIRAGGLTPGTRGVSVSGNVVSDSGGDGIAMWAVEHAHVTGNTVSVCGGHGILHGQRVTGAARIEGNVVIGAARAGVKSPDGAGATRNTVV